MNAVVFPGQGSQAPGMGKSLFEANPEAKSVFEAVTSATGIDIAHLCFASDEDTLRRTENAQLALYTTGLAAYRALEALLPHGSIQAAAGHSVGEYAAFAASGIVSVEDGARLVQERGRLMAEAGKESPGAMAAVLGLDVESVGTVCSEIDGVCVVANDNCPGQVVVSGDPATVQSCSVALAEKGAKRVLPLNVSGAFHSPLMEKAADRFGGVLSRTTFLPGAFPVYSNVTMKPETEWSKLLQMQLKSTVHWTGLVTQMVEDGADCFVECGHGNVLSGLGKRIAKDARFLNVSDAVSLEETAKAFQGAAV